MWRLKPWLLTLYGTQALCYSLVVLISPVLLRNLGMTSRRLTLYSVLLGLPWILRPFAAPLLELKGTKRGWLVAGQAGLWVLCVVLALGLENPAVSRWSLAILFVMAVIGTFHEIVVDGFYLKLLGPAEQIRSLPSRIALFRFGATFASSAILSFSVVRMRQGLSAESAWRIVFGWIGILFLALFVAQLWMTPKLEERRHAWPIRGAGRRWRHVFFGFFKRPGLLPILPFLMLFRLGEAQLIEVLPQYFTSSRALGGLGIGAEEYARASSWLQPLGLCAGILMVAQWLKKERLEEILLPAGFAISVPYLILILHGLLRPEGTAWAVLLLVLQSTASGLGLGVTLVYLFRLSRGRYATSFFSIGYGVVVLSMAVFALLGPWLRDILGYPLFFTWIFFCTLPSLATSWVASKELRAFRT